MDAETTAGTAVGTVYTEKATKLVSGMDSGLPATAAEIIAAVDVAMAVFSPATMIADADHSCKALGKLG